jgi:hypothetical protein
VAERAFQIVLGTQAEGPSGDRIGPFLRLLENVGGVRLLDKRGMRSPPEPVEHPRSSTERDPESGCRPAEISSFQAGGFHGCRARLQRDSCIHFSK